jgi:hypothetical protein
MLKVDDPVMVSCYNLLNQSCRNWLDQTGNLLIEVLVLNT